MVFITHKVLNLVHSDTIACVLYELLVCRSLGFGIVFRDFPSRLRFHKFQYCSIFKVLLALLSDSSIIISKVVLFVKHFFDYFQVSLNLFQEVRNFLRREGIDLITELALEIDGLSFRDDLLEVLAADGNERRGHALA